MTRPSEIFKENQVEVDKVLKMAIIRKSGNSITMELPSWFKSLNVQKIVHLSQSESDGNLTLIMIYE